MPNRSFNSTEYRYGGANGQVKIDEINGVGNHYTAEYWEYDPRLGRRWNLDPVDQISISNYAVFVNNPVYYTDPNGDCPTCPEDANKGDTHDWGKATFTFDGENWATDLKGVEITGSRNQTMASDNTNVSMRTPDFTPRTTKLSDVVAWGDNKDVSWMFNKNSGFNLDQKKAIMRHRVQTAGARFNADPAGGLFMDFLLTGMTMGIGSPIKSISRGYGLSSVSTSKQYKSARIFVNNGN